MSDTDAFGSERRLDRLGRQRVLFGVELPRALVRPPANTPAVEIARRVLVALLRSARDDAISSRTLRAWTRCIPDVPSGLKHVALPRSESAPPCGDRAESVATTRRTRMRDGTFALTCRDTSTDGRCVATQMDAEARDFCATGLRVSTLRRDHHQVCELVDPRGDTESSARPRSEGTFASLRFAHD